MATLIKEGGLIRESSSNFKPTVFRQPLTLAEVALSYSWPADDCIVYYRTGRVRGYNSIVYDFNASAARWTVHAKIDSLGILPHL